MAEIHMQWVGYTLIRLGIKIGAHAYESLMEELLIIWSGYDIKCI